MSPPRESRPPENRRATGDQVGGQIGSILTERRRRWAYALIAKAKSPPPRYGSETWLALPEGSAEKVAAVVIAAEAWVVDGDDVAARMRRELDDAAHAEKAAEDADYQRAVGEHRERWGHLALVRPRYAGQQVRPLEDIGAEATGRGAP